MGSTVVIDLEYVLSSERTTQRNDMIKKEKKEDDRALQAEICKWQADKINLRRLNTFIREGEISRSLNADDLRRFSKAAYCRVLILYAVINCNKIKQQPHESPLLIAKWISDEGRHFMPLKWKLPLVSYRSLYRAIIFILLEAPRLVIRSMKR